MSELSYLEKLLDGVEVEWKAVGDIAGYSTTKVDADKLDATSFVGVDNLLADKGGRIDATYQPNTARLTAYEPGDILLGNIRPYLKKVWMAENNGGCSGDVLAIRILADCKKIISPEYLYYALSSDSFFSYSMQHAKGAKMPRGSKDAILNYQIPIPCPSAPEKSLAIQSEIVRILDKFTAITAELTAEFNMRKKQYNYYRDQLLSFKEGEVEWKALEEVSDIYDSLHQTPQYSKNGLSMIRVTDIKNGYIDLKNTLKVNDGIFSIFTKKYLPQKNDLVMSRVGSYGNVGIIPTDNSACMGQNTVVIHPYINNRYLFYILTSSIGQDFIEKNVGGGSQKTLSLKSIKSIPIPLTGESEQSKIVSILDKFDTLTNSITEGLPREIELRQKQYEYYRDLLFSFPKPETVSN